MLVRGLPQLRRRQSYIAIQKGHPMGAAVQMAVRRGLAAQDRAKAYLQAQSFHSGKSELSAGASALA